MKNKLFLIFICLILLSISAVSAGDINQTNIDEVDNSVLSTSNNVIVDTTSASEDTNFLETQDNEIYVNSSVKVNGDGSKDNPFQDLKSAMDNVNSGSTIYIAPGIYVGENNTGLNIFKSLNLINWTNGDIIFDLNGEQYGFTFEAYPDNNLLNITGLTFINYTSWANVIYIQNTNMIISNCNFINNNASSNGVVTISGGNVTISNCDFINNTASLGGAIYIRKSNDTISNCNFINNTAYSGGALYSYHSNDTISNCNFINNSGNGNNGGGAFYSEYGPATVSNCSFVNNSALGGGGAIYIYDSSIFIVNNSTFIYNKASAGSGNTICSQSTTIFITNSDFLNNTIGWGGVIDITGINSTIYNSNFINNSGNAYEFITTVNEIHNCNFINNSVGNANLIGARIINNCSFLNNTAGMNIIDGANIFNCNFTNNYCDSIFYIFSGKGNRTIYNSNFLKNIVDNSVINFESSYIDFGNISNCNFFNNTANTKEIIHSESKNMDISNCSFLDNDASRVISTGRSNISNCSFLDNGASSGFICSVYSSNISNCSFLNNSGKNGVIYCHGNDTISNNNFLNNNGMTIYLESSYDYDYSTGYLYKKQFMDHVILNNNSLNGGRIYNKGVISSPTTIIVLDNKTTDALFNDIIYLNATIYDDNNNIIICDDLNFVLPNNIKIKGQNNYDNDSIYRANTTLTNGKNIITANSENLVNNAVKIGIVNVNSYDFNINVVDVVKYYGGSERFIVNLTNKNNAPISNVTVKININGVSYNRTTDDKGSCSIGLTLNSGNYEVITEYKNISVKSNVTIKTTIFSNNVEKIFKNNTQYYATFLDTDGSLLKNTTVQFNINGVMYYRTTDDKGVARLNINLGQGNYILTAINPISGEQKANNITVLPSIIENDDITKYYKNDTQYVVKVLNLDGSVAGAGVNVTFNINGVFYTRTTNASGYAKLNINLAPDEYIITAEYNGLKVSNTIKVLPVLSANDLTMSYKDGSKFEVKLLDGQGNAYASQTIKFNINGVFYDRTTDANGIAKLNINLMSGKYIITSMYNGAAISNEVTIS